MDTHFQIGIVVPALERAMAELGAALGVGWVGPRVREVGEWRIRIAFARTGPPHLELIEGPPGSLWEPSVTPVIHHLGYWSDDIVADSALLEANGHGVELDLGHARYHRARGSGLRVELIDSATRPAFYARWGLPNESSSRP